MTETLENLVRYGYVALPLWVFAEQMGIPIPAAPILLAAGAMAGMGRMDLLFLSALAFAGALIADLFWYGVGYAHGPRVLGRICGICLEPDSCVRRAKNLLERYGLPILLLAKFVPGLIAVAAPLAGTIRITWWQFAAIDSLGICIWAATFELLGFAFADQLQRVGVYAWRSSAVVVATAPSVYSPPTLLESVWHGNGFFETFGWLGLVRRNLRRSFIDMSRSPW